MKFYRRKTEWGSTTSPCSRTATPAARSHATAHSTRSTANTPVFAARGDPVCCRTPVVTLTQARPGPPTVPRSHDSHRAVGCGYGVVASLTTLFRLLSPSPCSSSCPGTLACMRLCLRSQLQLKP